MSDRNNNTTLILLEPDLAEQGGADSKAFSLYRKKFQLKDEETSWRPVSQFNSTENKFI